MQLYLVQHGEAKSEEEDPERPLTERGRQDVQRVAGMLAGRAVPVTAVYHSGKLRAQQTAELLGAVLKPPKGVVQLGGLAPTDDPAVVVRALQGFESPAMLVGHLPHLGRLAALLVTGDSGREVVAFRMGGVVRLGRDEAGPWRVEWAIPPDAVP